MDHRLVQSLTGIQPMQRRPLEPQWRLRTLGQIMLAAAVSLIFQANTGSVHAQSTGFSWGVVVGADRSIQEARDEAKQAAAKIGRKPSIFICNDWFRTVFVLTDRREAFQLLDTAQRRIRPSAYLVDLRIWCPNKRMAN